MELPKIHCSSLTAYPDCGRRAAARMYGEQLQAMGYQFQPSMQSAAASTGTALHKGVASLLKSKKAFGDITRNSVELAVRDAQEYFTEKSAKETIWDKTTPHLDTALAQIRSMMLAFAESADRIQPDLVEETFEVPVRVDSCNLILTGTLDCFDVHGYLWDHKTGASLPVAHAQLGGYAIMLDWHNRTVNGARLNYVKRVGIKKVDEQPEAQTLDYDLALCKQMAWSSIKEIVRHFIHFTETQNPSEFPANPMSKLCTKTYCLAFDTPWCRAGATLMED